MPWLGRLTATPMGRGRVIFRRPPRDTQEPTPATHERRLRALGLLLDERGYERDGLCILAIEGGFSVTGLRVPPRGAAYDLVQHTDTVDTAEIEALMARFRDRG